MNKVASSTHEVFISYAAQDKQFADAVCAVLERNRIRCWIAPRDVIPGANWRAAIVDRIGACKVLVLVFSSHANASEYVNQEVGLAIEKGLTVIPFRVQNICPIGEMELSLHGKHWLDAFTPPVEAKLEKLAESVKLFLSPISKSTPFPPVLPLPPQPKWPRSLLVPVATVMLVVLTAGAFTISQLTRPSDNRLRSSRADGADQGSAVSAADESHSASFPTTKSSKRESSEDELPSGPLPNRARVVVTKYTQGFLSKSRTPSKPPNFVQEDESGIIIQYAKVSQLFQVDLEGHEEPLWIPAEFLKTE